MQTLFSRSAWIAVILFAAGCGDSGPTAPTIIVEPPVPPTIITQVVVTPPQPPVVEVEYAGGGRFRTRIYRQGEVLRLAAVSIDGRAIARCGSRSEGRCFIDNGSSILVTPTASMIEHNAMVAVTVEACYIEYAFICGEATAFYNAGSE